MSEERVESYPQLVPPGTYEVLKGFGSIHLRDISYKTFVYISEEDSCARTCGSCIDLTITQVNALGSGETIRTVHVTENDQVVDSFKWNTSYQDSSKRDPKPNVEEMINIIRDLLADNGTEIYPFRKL